MKIVEILFEEFLEMVARKDGGEGLTSAGSLTQWKSWLREEIERKTRDIEHRERQELSRNERLEINMRICQDVRMNPFPRSDGSDFTIQSLVLSLARRR